MGAKSNAIFIGGGYFKISLRFWLENYKFGHNILRLFEVLPNFPFTTSETNRD